MITHYFARQNPMKPYEEHSISIYSNNCSVPKNRVQLCSYLSNGCSIALESLRNVALNRDTVFGSFLAKVCIFGTKWLIWSPQAYEKSDISWRVTTWLSLMLVIWIIRLTVFPMSIMYWRICGWDSTWFNSKKEKKSKFSRDSLAPSVGLI